jgi:hypothetical protein
VGELVKPDERDLGALVLEAVLLVLEVAHLDLPAFREVPGWGRFDGGGAVDPAVEFRGFVPQAALLGDLLVGPPKQRVPEVRVVGVAEAFQEEAPRFPA